MSVGVLLHDFTVSNDFLQFLEDDIAHKDYERASVVAWEERYLPF